MSTLRTHMTHDMLVRGLTETTQKSYLRAVTHLAQFAHRRPDQLSDRDVQRYLVHLVVYLSPADNCDGLLASRLRDGNQTVISPRISLSESLSALHPTFRTTSSILVHIQ